MSTFRSLRTALTPVALVGFHQDSPQQAGNHSVREAPHNTVSDFPPRQHRHATFDLDWVTDEVFAVGEAAQGHPDDLSHLVARLESGRRTDLVHERSDGQVDRMASCRRLDIIERTQVFTRFLEVDTDFLPRFAQCRVEIVSVPILSPPPRKPHLARPWVPFALGPTYQEKTYVVSAGM